jgi:hypothetical protein
MCNPVAVAGVGAGGKALGQVGNFMQQRAQAKAVNQGRANQYRNQLAMRELKYNTDVNAYSARMSDYRAGNLERADAASLAYQAAQGQLNETNRAAAYGSLGATQQLAAAQGRAAARGVSGQSAALQQQSLMSAFGRDQALQMDNLLRARYAYDRQTARTRNQLTSANRTAFNKIGPAPIAGIAPPKPVFQQGPSGLALVGNLAATAASGVGDAYSMSDAGNGGSWLDWKS